MKLVTTTGIFAPYYENNVAAPLAAMEKAGFTHVDLSMYRTAKPGSVWGQAGDMWKKEVDECLAWSGKLDFCQAHSPDGVHFAEGEDRDRLILATRRSIQACGILGIPHTVLHAGVIPGATPREFVKANISFCKQFEEDCEKYGVDLLIENSASAWYPEYYLQTGRELREFVELARMPRLHICWDTGHGNVQGCDQYSDILAMGEELHALHIQDNYGDADSHISPMMGTTNYDRVMEGLLAIGYHGDFTFEDGNAPRASGTWPNFRRDVKDTDKLQRVPLEIMQKQISITHDIGKWMLESFGIRAE